MADDEVVFYVGLHQPSDAHRFDRACVSINRVRGRQKPVADVDVLLDSGAFTELARFGAYRHDVMDYAREIFRLWSQGVLRIVAAVAQDFMCEPFMLARTGATDAALAQMRTYGPAPKAALIAIHQRWTVERYDAQVEALEQLFGGPPPFPVLPVLQGYSPADYLRHLVAYGSRLARGMWVGVGSVCKRNGAPEKIVEVLSAIKRRRPDLRLHGFGVKMTALLHAGVRAMLASADSMAWSFAARREGRDRNSWVEAKAFCDRIATAITLPMRPFQLPLFDAEA